MESFTEVWKLKWILQLVRIVYFQQMIVYLSTMIVYFQSWSLTGARSYILDDRILYFLRLFNSPPDSIDISNFDNSFRSSLILSNFARAFQLHSFQLKTFQLHVPPWTKIRIIKLVDKYLLFHIRCDYSFNNSCS